MANAISPNTGFPVVWTFASEPFWRDTLIVMKAIKRFVFGIFSSLLLAAGLLRAADSLDPMTNVMDSLQSTALTTATAESCSAPCDVDNPS